MTLLSAGLDETGSLDGFCEVMKSTIEKERAVSDRQVWNLNFKNTRWLH